jgi:hypothetical protein
VRSIGAQSFDEAAIFTIRFQRAAERAFGNVAFDAELVRIRTSL